MSVDIRNSEGYLDPTPYQAFLEIEHEEHRALRAFRPIIYICSPYAGNVEGNVAAARKYSRFAMERGYIPIAPHLLFPQFMEGSDPEQRRLGIFFGLVLQSKCKEVWVFGGNITKGMAVEIEKAHERGLPVRYFTERCVEVVRK